MQLRAFVTAVILLSAVPAMGQVARPDGTTVTVPTCTAQEHLTHNAGVFTCSPIAEGGGGGSSVTSKYVSTQFDKTSDTALANIPGLSVSVSAGQVYSFTATIFTTSSSSGGVKLAIGGTATATSIIYDGVSHEGNSTNTKQRSTTLGGAVAALTGATTALLRVDGTIVVNAAGTLTVQFAQNAGNVTTSSVLIGSNFVVRSITP